MLHTKYQSSALSSFREEEILKFSFFVPMCRTCDSPGPEPVLTQGTSYEESW